MRSTKYKQSMKVHQNQSTHESMHQNQSIHESINPMRCRATVRVPISQISYQKLKQSRSGKPASGGPRKRRRDAGANRWRRRPTAGGGGAGANWRRGRLRLCGAGPGSGPQGWTGVASGGRRRRRWWRHVAQSRPRQLRVVDGSSAASSVPPSEMARERH